MIFRWLRAADAPVPVDHGRAAWRSSPPPCPPATATVDAAARAATIARAGAGPPPFRR